MPRAADDRPNLPFDVARKFISGCAANGLEDRARLRGRQARPVAHELKARNL
jgi:hypothetical protein